MAKPKNLENSILKLRNLGYSYNHIQKELNCSKSTISYYCGQNQKTKTRTRSKKRLSEQPLIRKIERFCNIHNSDYYTKNLLTISEILKSRIQKFNMKNKTYQKPTFTLEQLLDKIGENPKCYLTGVAIDINKPSTYHLDHIIPRSRGGNNSLENLGLCSKAANQCKSDMTPDELIQLCKNILEHNGYDITKK